MRPNLNASAAFPNREKADNTDNGVKVEIRKEGDQGVEVQRLQSYGVGIDCHSEFIAVCVYIRRNMGIYRYSQDFDTDWESLKVAKQWVLDTIRDYPDPVPDLSLPLHYVIEATSTYHMPVIMAWKGIPSVINPMLAGATKRKTDELDAERLAFHDLTGVWKESYVAPTDIQELRVLLAAREHFSRRATQCSNRINNIIVRFGITVGRGTSVTKDEEVRSIVEYLASDNPSEETIKQLNVCPEPLPNYVKQLIRLEYAHYDQNRKLAADYLDVIRQKVYAINWQVKEGTIPGKEAGRILSTAPGVGELTSFTWLAFVGTPCRFPNAKALNAYSSLDPSVRVSAGKVTSTKKRGGCRILHTALVRSADRIIRSHSEGFGRWGYLLARSSGRWRKATNAVGRKINTALYYMLLTKQEFSYEKYTIVKDAVIFDIPVDDLVQLNKDFKRYIQILKDNDINTTADLITAYLSCSLANVRGLGRKFFLTLQDFLKEQHKYQDEYQKLHPSWKITQTVVKGGDTNAQTQEVENVG